MNTGKACVAASQKTTWQYRQAVKNETRCMECRYSDEVSDTNGTVRIRCHHRASMVVAASSTCLRARA